MKIYVNIQRRRGIITTDDFKTTATTLPWSECAGMVIYDCLHTLHGKSCHTIANQVLFGKGSKLAQQLTTIPAPYDRTEAFISVSKKQMDAEFGRACNPRKIGLGNKETRLCNIL